MDTLQKEAARLLIQTEAERACVRKPLADRLNALLSTGDEENGFLPAPRIYRDGLCASYAYNCAVLRPEPGIWLNAVLLRDMRAGDRALPATVMLWPGGVTRIAEHSNLIHRTVAEGRQAVILDLPGEGALLPAKLGGSDMYISWSTMYKLNAYLIQLGDSLAALRTRGVIAAYEALKRSELVQADDICLYSEGETDRYALCAALLCGVNAQVSGACQSYEEIVTSEYHDQTHTHAWALPGALTAFGTDEITLELKKRCSLL